MIDIVIPVYLPDEKLEQLLDKLKNQTMKPQKITLIQTVVDAEDKTLTHMIRNMHNVKVIAIDKKDFDHGGTRNYGACLSDAEYVLFMTQDAVPENECLIEKLYQSMKDESVAVAFARQLPNKQAGTMERFTRNFNYPAKSRIKKKEDIQELGIKTYFCSNVCALYRMSVYKELGGFPLQTIFNEDMIMASKVIQAGYSIAYVAEAMVIHSHHYTYLEQFRRNFDLAVSQKQYQEVFRNIPSESEGKKLVMETLTFLMKNGKFYLVPDLVLQSGFKFMGYKAGLKHDKLPRKWVVRFSMNKSYWNTKYKIRKQ